MKPQQQEEPTAVFHDRQAMEDAVRALVARGIRPQRIQISQGVTTSGGIETVPETGGRLGTGLALGAAIGAALALVWRLWLSDRVAIPPAFMVLGMLAGAASGALVGALLVILLYAVHRKRRDARGSRTGEFVVTVKPEDNDTAKEIRDFLALRGGHLVPTPS